MTLYTLGTIDPLLVQRFSGFDLGDFTERVRLISDGTAGPHEVLQSSGLPKRQAQVTGVLLEAADVALLRGYDESKAEVAFTDFHGNSTQVSVLELTTEDHAGWWDFTCTLLAQSATTPEAS